MESLDDFDRRFKMYGRATRLISEKYNLDNAADDIVHQFHAPRSYQPYGVSGQIFTRKQNVPKEFWDLAERRNKMLMEGFNSI